MAVLENFLGAMHGQSGLPFELADDAGILLKVINADTAPIDRVKDAVICLEKCSQILVGDV